MPRIAGLEPVYEAFNLFLNRCIRSDTSLLIPQIQAWTVDNVQWLKTRMVDQPIETPGMDFYQKMEVQLKGASREHWLIIADMFYVYFLPTDTLTDAKRKKDMDWVCQNAPLVLPGENDPMWSPLECGFTGTGQRYHMKFAQFWLLILFALRVKMEPVPAAILDDYRKMQAILDEILESIDDRNARAYDLRHAILYMAHPDKYEKIISTRHKEQIAKYYRQFLPGTTGDDLDDRLRILREKMRPKLDLPHRPYDYYRPEANAWLGGKAEKKLSEAGMRDEEKQSEMLHCASRVVDLFSRTRNLILYGPPGTGKTYLARQAAELMMREQAQRGQPEEVAFEKVIDGLTFYDVLALGMYRADSEGSYAVPDLHMLPLVQARLRESPVQHPTNTIWGNLQTHSDPESATVNISRRWAPYLFDKDEASRWSLTDEGRDYVRENLSEKLQMLQGGSMISEEDFITWITFHQSYSYEEFVEGLRPVTSEDDPGAVIYRVVPGVFRAACSRAAADPENRYLLIIDEINRGNIAKILGELITLLEDDKRTGEANALSVKLPYSQVEFSVPSNLYILGTMNTADRSIALLDTALRRRFAFVEILPEPELLDGVAVETEEARIDLGALLRRLNAGICSGIDRDHQLGHSYFITLKGIDDPEERLQVFLHSWRQQIVPMLAEYFYGREDDLQQLLPTFFTDVEIENERGLSSAVDVLQQASDEDVLAALAAIA